MVHPIITYRRGIPAQSGRWALARVMRSVPWARASATLNGQKRKGDNDMRTTCCKILIATSAMIGTIDVLHAQPEENPGRTEFLLSAPRATAYREREMDPWRNRSALLHPI